MMLRFYAAWLNSMTTTDPSSVYVLWHILQVVKDVLNLADKDQ